MIFPQTNFEAVFADKKSEILAEYEKLNTIRQELEAYRAATLAILQARSESLTAREIDVNKTLDEISRKERNIEVLLAKNEELLKELKDTMQGKILEVYAKMKDGAASAIITELPRLEAARILYHLAPKKIATILTKTDPKISAELTEIMGKNELFDQNSSDTDLSTNLDVNSQKVNPNLNSDTNSTN